MSNFDLLYKQSSGGDFGRVFFVNCNPGPSSYDSPNGAHRSWCIGGGGCLLGVSRSEGRRRTIVSKTPRGHVCIMQCRSPSLGGMVSESVLCHF
jgi:hypothetical protein